MDAYASLAKEIKTTEPSNNNALDIGEIKSLEPIIVALTDIALEDDDLILSDKIKKLITPLIPEIECETSCTGECTCTTTAKIKKEKYEEDKLKVGDKVILLSLEDGQKFILIDRLDI